MIRNSDYADIHDMIEAGDFEYAAKALLKQSHSAVADFTKSFVNDEGASKMVRVCRWMHLLEKLVNSLETMDVPESRKTDFRWLNRNLMFRNNQHPNFETARACIKVLLQSCAP